MRRTRLDHRTLLALIESAYAAAEDVRLWEPLLTSLADAVGGTSACLISHDLVASGSAVVMAGLDPEVITLYNQHYHKVDAWALAPTTPWLAKAYVTLEDEAVLSRRDLKRTEFYPYLRKYDISRMMHATLQVDARGSAGLSVYRQEADRPFGTLETGFLKALAPHLSRALRMHDLFARAANERETAFEGLDLLPIGVLLVTGEGRVLHANRCAEAILTARDGLFLDHSILTASSPTNTTWIRRQIGDCANTTGGDGLKMGGALSLPRPSGRRNLQVLVSPVKRVETLGLRHDLVVALVFVADPEQEALPSARLLQMLYGLTVAESAVAVLLASGRSVAEISSTSGYTVETVRWYSKQILSKTGCRSRAELVHALSAPLASVASPSQHT